jgi:hypothetical protein
VLLHDAQELNNDLGAGSDQNLTLSSFLGIVDAFQRIIEDGCSDHLCGDGVVIGLAVDEILKSRKRGLEVSA